MNQLFFNRITATALAVSALFVVAGRAQSAEISGTISATLIIYDDTKLVGDVTCMVADAPCIQLGARGITLRLNGFTITGPADPPTNCTSTASFSKEPEDGIQVLQDGVAILGPGLVRKFRRWGISLGNFQTGTGVKHVAVKHVTFSENCFSGIQLIGVTDSEIEGNISVRNAGGSNGFPCGGT
jgi:hypothetical protein